MINSTFQVTFGIEVECILAFHESLLRRYLATIKTDCKIIKTVPEDVRRKLNQVPQHYLDEDARRHDVSRQKYMGWGLTAPTAYPPERDNVSFQDQMDIHLETYGYRAYGGEVLHVAQTLFLPDEVEVHDSFNGANKYTDFSHWHVTHERGLVGLDKRDLMQRLERLSKAGAPGDLRKMLKQPSMTKDWDTHPLELVSRVLPYDSASIAEVHRHLKALQEGLAHFAFATKHCGLHVHVGLPVPTNHLAGTPPPTFTLPTLQHLAYIQVMYQAKISELHPTSRGDGTNIDLKSNLDNFYEEPEPLTDAEYTAMDARIDAGEDPDVVFAEQPPTFSFKKAREKIFAKDMTIEKLSELMGGNEKWRIVNWKYVARTKGEARTLEFRQHEGTLSPVAVEHWTAFVVGLVRLAEHHSRFYGSAPDYDGSGYKYRELSEESSVWDLMETMELGESEEEYWRDVVASRA
ncbi:hypothetical protein HO173_010403 [Letharia columbiana]|uniref:Uncharacterized protein n=1 Tax=Letharia columbiana TaxID=112416 RepID=A0A8H6FMU8_9LECA|nr:uncharacterized protein HO173_010403 [Letharia columbiana]KAF6231442.1 hypothetical protein HO173_010403 [Letharia columbiana]